MIKRLYELVTGTPWTTTVGGPMLAAEYPEWLQLSDFELMSMTTAEAIAWADARRIDHRPIHARQGTALPSNYEVEVWESVS